MMKGSLSICGLVIALSSVPTSSNSLSRSQETFSEWQLAQEVVNQRSLTGSENTLASPTTLDFTLEEVQIFESKPMPIALGQPNRGKLRDGIEVLEDECLIPTHLTNSYATQELYDTLRLGGCAVAQEYGVRLTLMDLSREGGGKLRPHKSHQNGRDADVSPYRIIKGQIVSTTPKNNSKGKAAMEVNWDLVKGFQQSPHPVTILWYQSNVWAMKQYVVQEHGQEEWNKYGSVFKACAARTSKDEKPYCLGHQNHMHLRVGPEIVRDRYAINQENQ